MRNIMLQELEIVDSHRFPRLYSIWIPFSFCVPLQTQLSNWMFLFQAPVYPPAYRPQSSEFAWSRDGPLRHSRYLSFLGGEP